MLDWKETPLDLSSNTNLQTLNFETNVMLPYVWGSLPTIPEMLSTVTSPYLSTFSVHLSNLDEEPVPSRCLSTMDDILERFRSLSEVKLHANVHAKYGSGREQALERIHRSIHLAMPKMLEKGALCIESAEK